MIPPRLKKFYIIILVYLYAQLFMLKHVGLFEAHNSNDNVMPLSPPANDLNAHREEQKGMGVINNIAHQLRVAPMNMNYSVPNTPGAFIHLSKTGGSSISKLLKNGCHSFVTKPCQNISSEDETPLSRLTTYFHVPDFPHLTYKSNDGQGLYRDYDFYIFTTRDPFDRAISAFLYSLPRNQMHSRFDWKKYNETITKNPKIDRKKLEDDMKNKILQDMRQSKSLLAYNCFPSLQKFVDLIAGDESESKMHDIDKKASWERNAHDCTTVATLAIYHQVDGMQHLFWDLRKLMEGLNGMNDHKPILVIRNEFISYDWDRINRLFGHNGKIDEPPTNFRNSSMFPVGKDLTIDGRAKLCRSIEHDYEIYFQVLVRSLNLDHSDLEKSFHIAQKNCPTLNISKWY